MTGEPSEYVCVSKDEERQKTMRGLLDVYVKLHNSNMPDAVEHFIHDHPEYTGRLLGEQMFILGQVMGANTGVSIDVMLLGSRVEKLETVIASTLNKEAEKPGVCVCGHPFDDHNGRGKCSKCECHPTNTEGMTDDKR